MRTQMRSAKRLVLRLLLRAVGAGLVSGARSIAPVPAIADDALDDEVVRSRRRAEADAEVDLPFGRDVQVGDGEDLLLLVMQAGGRGKAAVVGVVLEAGVHLLCEVVAHLGAGREVQAIVYTGAVPGAFERGIDGKIPTANCLVDDGADLPRPCVGRVDRALIADLHGERGADRPCLLYTSPSPRDRQKSRMPSSA